MKFSEYIRFDATALAALVAAGEVNPLIVKGVAEALQVQTGGMGGAFVWPSLIRKLDKLDDSYKS